MTAQFPKSGDSRMNWRKAILLLAKVTGLHLASCNQQWEDSIALTNVNLVTMTDESVIEHQTVLVEGSKILAIGDSDALEIPGGTQVMDGKGAYLMPGLLAAPKLKTNER
jgi:imidazolonepropionase-like amidohydrolase